MERKDHRASIGFPPEMVQVLTERAKENGRSLSKEVIQIVKVFLAQEQKEKDATGTSILRGK